MQPNLVGPVILYVSIALDIASTVLGVYAAIDAALRRPDAFAAADKQSKGVWAGITIASAGVFVLGLLYGGPFESQQLLWVAAMVGALVYLLDVRPRLREVQRGSRW